MSTTLTKPTVPSDVFVRIDTSWEYCMQTKEVTNGTAADWDLPPGYPMDDNVPVVAANIANLDGLLYDRAKIAAGETAKVLVLVRGPVVINSTNLPAADYVGAAIANATFVTNLADIPQLVTRVEGSIQATLTTDG